MSKLVRGFSLVVVVLSLSLAAVGCQSSEEVTPEVAASVDELGKADKLDCSAVRCALPLCAQGQHLAYQGSCCPTCVGAPSRCATVLCAAVVCGEGQVAVTAPGQCCPRCTAAPAVKECQNDADCPQYYCIQCPCPYSQCRGSQCVTQTPDVSTCGGSTL